MQAVSQDKPAYRLYDGEGKQVKYKDMVKKLSQADIVMFGEQHDDPIAHWLQYEVTMDLHERRGEDLLLGAEMFEEPDQLVIDEYLNGTIREKDFKNVAKLWPNYATDYKPLLDLAKDNGLEFIATNVPRRYAALVHQKGLSALDSLDEQAKEFMAPLPIEVDTAQDSYKRILKMGRGHGSMRMLSAQALKDVTMSYNILQNHEKGDLFVHYNGSFHSDHHEGIVHYLKKEDPDLEIMTISTVAQEDVTDWKKENKEKGDYVLCVPKTMTSTH